MDRCAAIILCAGYSSRMGRNKALLPIFGMSLILKQILCYRNAGLDNIHVVVGHDSDAIKSELKGYDIRIIDNAGYSEGMFTSVKAGLRAIEKGGYGSFTFLPVDYALIRPGLIMKLLDSHKKTGKGFTYPRFNGKKGHPPIINMEYYDEIVGYSGEGGIKGVIKKYDAIANFVEMPTYECIFDVDTPEAYEEAKAAFEKKDHPGGSECEDLLYLNDTPPQLVGHCKKVASVTDALCEALEAKGMSLPRGLIHASALLHDIEKTKENHAVAGAALLEKMFYPRVAGIIKNHMVLGEEYRGSICPESILYLADKMVKGETVIKLEERLECCNGTDNAVFARERLSIAISLRHDLEGRIGRSIYEIIE